MNTDIFERFRCKECDGAGRHDDHPCDPCKGEGYTIPPEQRQLWAALIHAIDHKVLRYRNNLMREAERVFNQHFPPENPLCQAHPKVRESLASTARKAMTLPVGPVGKKWPRIRLVSIATFGLNNLWPRLMRSSQKTTSITA